MKNSWFAHRWAYAVTLVAGLSVGLAILVVVTAYADYREPTPQESHLSPARPRMQATPTATCPVPPAWGRQPRPTEMVNSFDRAGTDRLGNAGPDLPEMWKGYPPAQATRDPAYVPCILLKAMGWEETPEWGGWKQFDAGYGQWGYTTIFHDPGGSCGYGVMQITSGMGGGAGFDPNRVAAEYLYNIGTGARILIEKWNLLGYYIGGNNPYVVEDWYYAVWAYNGWGWWNNPNRNCGGQWYYGCDNYAWDAARFPYNGTQDRRRYPYQELIWGRAANPPGADFWQAVPLTLPPRDDVYTYEGGPPPTHIDRPEPHHGSCSVVYLPIILRSYPPVVPTPTPTPTPIPSCVEGSDPIQNRGFETVVPDTPGYDAPPWVDIIYDGNCPQCYLIWKYSDTCNDNCYGVWLGGRDNANEEIYQTIYLPHGVTSATCTFWMYVTTEETSPNYDYDWLYWDLKDDATGQSILVSPVTYTNRFQPQGVWVKPVISITNLHWWAGHTIRVSFADTTDFSNVTSFWIDDVTFTLHCD